MKEPETHDLMFRPVYPSFFAVPARVRIEFMLIVVLVSRLGVSKA